MANRFLFFLCALMIVACGPEKKAQKKFKLAKYQSVINYYTKVVSKQPNNGRANYFLAESYRLSNRIKESEPYYKNASGKGISKDTMLLYYSQALKANGKYEEARKPLEEIESSGEDDNIKLV